MTQQVTTTKVRLSYVNVFEPKGYNENPPKYSVTCLLPKEDTKGLEILQRAIQAEFEEEKNGKLKGVQKPVTPIHDGDGTKKSGEPYGEECKGHWVFTASAYPEYPPAVMDRNVQPILDPTEVYSGCYGHVALSVYAYNNQSKGIGFGLNGVQKVADGEPLGSTFDPNSAFSVVEPQSSGGVDPLTGLPL